MALLAPVEPPPAWQSGGGPIAMVRGGFWMARCLHLPHIPVPRAVSQRYAPPDWQSQRGGGPRLPFTRAAAAAVAIDHERHDARWAARGGGGDPRGAAAASHACTRVHDGISKGGLGGRRKVGEGGGSRESVVQTAPHGPRGTRWAALPQRSRGVAAGVYPVPPPPTPD